MSLIPLSHSLTIIVIGGVIAAACGALWLLVLRPLLLPAADVDLTLQIIEFTGIGIVATLMAFLLSGHAASGRSSQMALLAGIVQNTTAGVWILDDQLRTVWCNSALNEIVGSHPEPGSLPFAWLDAEDAEVLRRNAELRARGQSSTYEVTIRRADGAARNTLVLGSPVQDPDGNWLGSFGLFIDVTEQVQELDRASRRDRLETLGAVIARLNHKINNALMVIRGQAEILLRHAAEGEDRTGPERIVEYVDIIYGELEAISSLKDIDLEPYPGGQAMLRIPEEGIPADRE